MKKFISVSLFISLTLTGCTSNSSGTADGDIPTISTTVSEQEFCQSISEIPTQLISSVEPREGLSEAKALWAHLSGVAAVLEEEGSTLHPLTTPLLERFSDLVSVFYSEMGFKYPVGIMRDLLPEAADASSKVVSWCNERNLEIAGNVLTGELEQVYPDGAWSDGATQSLVHYTTDSMNNRIDFSTNSALEVDFNEGGNQVSLQAACNVDSKIFAVLLIRRNQMFEGVDFGPSGKTKFKYAIDDGELVEAPGYFYNGAFLPFVESGSDAGRTSGGQEAFTKLLSSGKNLRIVLESPGSQLDAEFFVNRSPVLESGLNSLGCFDF